jgi:hypothetical protein
VTWDGSLRAQVLDEFFWAAHPHLAQPDDDADPPQAARREVRGDQPETSERNRSA